MPENNDNKDQNAVDEVVQLKSDNEELKSDNDALKAEIKDLKQKKSIKSSKADDPANRDRTPKQKGFTTVMDIGKRKAEAKRNGPEK